MIEAVEHLAHQAFFGGVAAAGFGILFNFGTRDLLWCFAAGAIALGLRTLGLDAGWSLEAASFVAAACLSVCVAGFLHPRLDPAPDMIALTGCIPMVPGAFLAQAILGLFALTSPNPDKEITTVVLSVEYLLRVAFTICAIGTGLAVPLHILKLMNFRGSAAE